MELFLFTMHQLALSSEFPCDDNRPPSRAFLTEWLRRRRAESNALLTDDLHLTSFERQQLMVALEVCYETTLPATETDKLHTIREVELYLHRHLSRTTA